MVLCEKKIVVFLSQTIAEVRYVDFPFHYTKYWKNVVSKVNITKSITFCSSWTFWIQTSIFKPQTHDSEEHQDDELRSALEPRSWFVLKLQRVHLPLIVLHPHRCQHSETGKWYIVMKLILNSGSPKGSWGSLGVSESHFENHWLG